MAPKIPDAVNEYMKKNKPFLFVYAILVILSFAIGIGLNLEKFPYKVIIFVCIILFLGIVYHFMQLHKIFLYILSSIVIIVIVLFISVFFWGQPITKEKLFPAQDTVYVAAQEVFDHVWQLKFKIAQVNNDSIIQSKEDLENNLDILFRPRMYEISNYKQKEMSVDILGTYDLRRRLFRTPQITIQPKAIWSSFSIDPFEYSIINDSLRYSPQDFLVDSAHHTLTLKDTVILQFRPNPVTQANAQEVPEDKIQ
jgi:hypothetical protein